jgi:hypothetical protein
VPADRLLARAHEIADGIAALPPPTSRSTRIALTQKMRRLIDEGLGYSLALEGISAADVAPRAKLNGDAKGLGPTVPSLGCAKLEADVFP